MNKSEETVPNENTPRPTRIYHWPNGMTMTFDQFGKQMPEYQGSTSEVLPKLAARNGDPK